MYQVNLFYKDDKHMTIDVLDHEIKRFFDELNQSQVYIHPETQVGFWTNMADIRYIKIIKKEVPHEEAIREAQSSPEVVQGEDVSSEEGSEPAE